MLCEKCLNEIIIPKLREDDIAILQHLYNESVMLPQTAQHKYYIANKIGISYHRVAMACFRLECYNMIEQQPWAKASNYYLTEDGIKSLNFLLERMGE